MPSIDQQICRLKEQLATLDNEKARVSKEIDALTAQLKTNKVPPAETCISPQFTLDEKIAIFMRLFRGRDDVFPKRWDNPKTGKSGYSPACQNEWVRGICKKPQIKCSECPHQKFIPLTNEVIRKHLAGNSSSFSKQDYTIGVYPMLKDETCWFLAIDFDKVQWQRGSKAWLEKMLLMIKLLITVS